MLRSVFIFCLVGDLSILIKADSQEAMLSIHALHREKIYEEKITLSLQSKFTVLADSPLQAHRVKKNIKVGINSQQLTHSTFTVFLNILLSLFHLTLRTVL